jgi:hypothetical protein
MIDSQAATALGARVGLRKSLQGAVMVSLVYLFFVWFWWNKFYTPVSGWMEYGSRLMGRGEIPYRDFYLFIPPLHLFEYRAIQKLFGEALWITRIPGILQRLGISLTVMAWLARLYPVRVVVPAVIAGTMVSETCVYMGFFAYFYTSLLYAVLMGLAAHLALEAPSGRPGWALLAGLFGGLSSLSKQTIGPFTTAVTCSVLALILWRRAGWRPAAKAATSLSLGWWIPVGATLAWLAYHGALWAFLEQVFLEGPSSKGSLGTVLIRPAVVMSKWLQDGILYPIPTFVLYGRTRVILIGIVLLALAIGSRCRALPAEGLAKISRTWAVSVTLLCLVAIFVATRVAPGYAIESNSDLMYLQFVPHGAPSLAKAIISRMAFVSIYVCLAGLLLSTFRFWRDPASAGHASRVLLYAVCLAVYYSATVSMGAQGYEPIGFTAVSAMMAGLLTLDFRVAPRLMRALVASLAMIACFGVTCIKLDLPLSFVGWTEQPTDQAIYRSRQPLLRGMVLTSETVDCLDRIVGLIERHSEPGEPIFAYPSMPIFYYLTDRNPPTFAYVNYYDVCADKFVREDARRLLERPPAVIVMMEFPRISTDFHEKTFRGGGAPGQREMEDALANLTAGYELVATLDGKSYTYGDRGRYPIKVWARPRSERLSAARPKQ